MPQQQQETHNYFGHLPKDIQEMFFRAFDDGHNHPEVRPAAKEWLNAFALAGIVPKPITERERRKLLVGRVAVSVFDLQAVLPLGEHAGIWGRERALDDYVDPMQVGNVVVDPMIDRSYEQSDKKIGLTVTVQEQDIWLGIPDGATRIGKRVLIRHRHTGAGRLYCNFGGGDVFGRTPLPSEAEFQRDIYGSFVFRYEAYEINPKRWIDRFMPDKMAIPVDVGCVDLETHASLLRAENMLLRFQKMLSQPTKLLPHLQKIHESMDLQGWFISLRSAEGMLKGIVRLMGYSVALLPASLRDLLPADRLRKASLPLGLAVGFREADVPLGIANQPLQQAYVRMRRASSGRDS
jgi:hypothetical protein